MLLHHIAKQDVFHCSGAASCLKAAVLHIYLYVQDQASHLGQPSIVTH